MLFRSDIFMTNEKEIVLFETEDKKITFPVEVKDETVWLSVSRMAQLFDREESNIRRHVLNVFKENEVDENNNVHFLHVNNVKNQYLFILNLQLYLEDLFDDFYEIQEKFDRDCKYDQEDILWV